MKAKNAALAFIFSLLVTPALMISFQNFSPNSPVQQCNANSYQQILGCLNTVRSADTILKILLTNDITLDVNQVVRLKNVEGVTLAGASGPNADLPVTITETNSRLIDVSSDSKYFFEIVDGAKDIRIENLNFIDPANPERDLHANCRTKSTPVGTAMVGDVELCRAPVLVGGVNSNAERITLHKISVTSQKQFLVAVRKTDGLTIDESQFSGGSVTAVFFQAGFRHFNTTIHHCFFTLAGTAALSISDVDTFSVYASKFINNHIDPQYTYLAPDGSVKIYPGGQLYLGDAKSTDSLAVGPLSHIKILSNEITMEDSYVYRTDISMPTTAGIEIMNGNNSGIDDVLVQWNKISNLPRAGISLHCPPEASGVPCFKSDDSLKITVRDNVLYQNLRGFPGLDDRSSVNLEQNPHSGSDVFLNSLYIPGTGYIKADISSSDQSCNVDPVSHLCSVTIRASLDKIPAGSSPVIRVNGALFKAFGAGNTSVQAAANWIKKQSYVFSLHLNSNENEPAIANWNVRGL